MQHTSLKLCLLVLMTLLCFPADGAKPKRTINSVKKEQKATQKAIKETSRKISVNTTETKRNLSRLNSLSGEISARQTEIVRMKTGIDSLDRRIESLTDSVTAYKNELEALRSSYITSLRTIQRSSMPSGTMAFIFSSKSFSQAYQRVRYVRQINKWRERKSDEIKDAIAALEEQQQRLEQFRQARRTSLSQLNTAQTQLIAKRAETDRLVSKLKKEGGALRTLLKEKEKEAKALDRELNRLIEEQARIEAERRRKEEAEARRRKESEAKAKGQEKKTGQNSQTTTIGPNDKKSAPAPLSSVADADRKLTGDFESNKGRLLFPVSGNYRIIRGFGRQKHPELEYVETDNSGIDIEVPSGTRTRAIFAGKVSAIFKQPGYNTIVMVRHGSYLSIYANLGSIAVKVGDEVKANQTIGTIYSDPDDDNRAVLHFELRKERTKLNPTLWVK